MKPQVKEITADPDLIAFCGLYCGACKRFLSGKCPGCRENEKARWCKVRTCCLDNACASCADCREKDDVVDCGKYNNFVARLFGLVFRSDRRACIQMIKDMGRDAYASEMTRRQTMTVRR